MTEMDDDYGIHKAKFHHCATNLSHKRGDPTIHLLRHLETCMPHLAAITGKGNGPTQKLFALGITDLDCAFGGGLTTSMTKRRVVIADNISDCLLNWGIVNKASTITLDNASTNDALVKSLRDSFAVKGKLFFTGPKGKKLDSFNTKKQESKNFKKATIVRTCLHHPDAPTGSSSNVNSRKGEFPLVHHHLDASHHRLNVAKPTCFCFSTKVASYWILLQPTATP
ncbi:unnamed protein product [Ilex paraguariensis]|uniref:Uncharacterized protein n=1 Tax=Ilex paraguariensis TaxID=185542 RepID=A0ABC8RJ80_9AQUA